jgi:hypothetical protein
MFSVEVKVNGVMIGHLYGQNRGYKNSQNFDICSYTYE